MSDRISLLESLIARARKLGAEHADAVVFDSVSSSVSFRLGKLEEVDRSESSDLGLRVFIGKRQAAVASNDMSSHALEQLAERAVAMARTTPEDPFCGLAPSDQLARTFRDLDLEDKVEPSSEKLVELARSCEGAALGTAGITNSEGAGAGWGRGAVALVTSDGFAGAYATTSVSVSVSVIAGEGTGMERDYEFSSARHLADLGDPQEVGRNAASMALKRLNARRVKSQSVPVVFDPRTANSMLGHFAGAIVNVRDVTQQKIESEMQNTFISVISHELKTPVSIIKGYAEMLARPDVTWRPEQIRDSLQIIIEEADRLGNEINSLLDVSRMQLNALHLELSSWPIQALIEQVCVRFAAQAERSGVHLEVRISEDIPDVFADREKTRLVCENLITNAMKYSPSGGTIRIQGRRDQALAIISVTDQGIGIPLEEQGKIFDRFYRVDNRVSRETQGFGIGLFLAKSIVEAQKGQIWVESRPQQGARFSFSLPLSTSRIGGTVEIADDVVIDLSSGEEST